MMTERKGIVSECARVSVQMKKIGIEFLNQLNEQMNEWIRMIRMIRMVYLLD